MNDALPLVLFAAGAVLTLIAYLWKRSENAADAERRALRSDLHQVRADHDEAEAEVLSEIGRLRDRIADHEARLPDRFVTRAEWQEALRRWERIDDKLDRLLDRVPNT